MVVQKLPGTCRTHEIGQSGAGAAAAFDFSSRQNPTLVEAYADRYTFQTSTTSVKEEVVLG
jgi:hypothetical protein